jgi:hypothetical protein
MPSYTITKPSWFSCTHEFRTEGRLVGELKMLKKLSYALAEARMGDRVFRFGYTGWTARKIFIHDTLGKDIGSVRSLSWWNHDTIVEIDGKTYEWKQKNWWNMRSVWSASGKEIMEFRTRWSGSMTVDAPAPLNDTEAILLLFGSYLLRLQEMEAAATGA